MHKPVAFNYFFISEVDRKCVISAVQITSFTATLIMVSVTFLALNIPADVYFLLLADSRLRTPGVSSVFYSSVNLALYTNHSINFIMYFVSGRKFRTAAIDTISGRWCRRGRSHLAGKSTTAGRSDGTTMGVNSISRTENLSLTDVNAGTPSGGSRCQLNG